MTNPNPGFVPQDVYDVVRNKVDKLRERIELLTAENDQLREACARLQTNQGFVKASDVSDQEGEARIRDTELIKNFVMDALKLKPREIVIKYRGNTIIEIIPKT